MLEQRSEMQAVDDNLERAEQEEEKAEIVKEKKALHKAEDALGIKRKNEVATSKDIHTADKIAKYRRWLTKRGLSSGGPLTLLVKRVKNQKKIEALEKKLKKGKKRPKHK